MAKKKTEKKETPVTEEQVEQVVEQTAEAAHRGEHFGAAGSSQKRFHILEKIGGKIDVHPGVFVKFTFSHNQKFQNFLVPS